MADFSSFVRVLGDSFNDTGRYRKKTMEMGRVFFSVGVLVFGVRFPPVGGQGVIAIGVING